MKTRRTVSRSMYAAARYPGLAIASAALLAGSLMAGCSSSSGTAAGSSGSSSGKAVNIAFLGYSAANGYTENSFKAAQSAAAKLGAKVTFFDGKFDGATQLAQARDAISSGKYQALEILPNNSVQMASVVKQALAKGMKVAAIDYLIGPDPTAVTQAGVPGITVQIADNMAANGITQGQQAAKLCQGVSPCKVEIEIGSKASTFDVIKLANIQKVLAQNSNIKVVGVAEDNFDPTKAEATTRDVLVANPDLNLVITTGDQHCVGAQRAAAAAGKTFSATTQQGGGKIACLGWGASTTGVQQILAGNWPSSIALVPESFGAKAAEALIQAVRDPSTPPLITTQAALSPIGSLATKDVLQQHPDFKGQWSP
jgi:ribose transport system substrate-binding protein